MLYTKQRGELLEVVEELLRFRLLDCTGGMMAVRCSPEHLLMTTFGAGFRRWHIDLDDFIVCDNQGDVVEMHEYGGPASMVMVLELFKEFPTCGAVLHSHAEFSLAFASLDRKLDDVPCLRAEDQQIKEEYLRNPYPVKVPSAMPNRPEVVAVNQHLLPQLKAKFAHRRDELLDHGLAYTTYRHGTTVFARDMNDALQTLVRIERSARAHIYNGPLLAALSGATAGK